jgi:hypothetical protein
MNATHGLEINKFALRIVSTILIVSLGYIIITSERRQQAQHVNLPTVATTALKNQIRQSNSLPQTELLQLLAQQNNFARDSLALLSEQTQESAALEVSLNHHFHSWQQQQADHATVQLDLAQCDVDICIISVSGMSSLSASQQQKIADSLQFQTALRSTALPIGGLMNHEKDKVFRQVLATNPRFAAH